MSQYLSMHTIDADRRMVPGETGITVTDEGRWILIQYCAYASDGPEASEIHRDGGPAELQVSRQA